MPADELRYAVRFRVVFKYFGQLALAVGLLSLVPLVFSVLYGEIGITLRYIAVVAVLAALWAGLGRMRAPANVQPNEAMVLVSLVYLSAPLLMIFPIMASGISFMNAFFETVSGITTTGLTAVGTMAGKPASFLFARAWMQWYGGLGIVILSLALLMRPGITAKSLAFVGTETDDLVGSTRAHARRTIIIYGLMTAASLLILLIAGLGPLNSLRYSLAAVSTGGFAPQDASLAAINNRAAAVLITISGIAGAVPFAFYYRRYEKYRHSAMSLLEVKGLLIAGVLFSILLGMFMALRAGAFTAETLYHAPLLAFSAQTTTGFSTLDPAGLGKAAKLVLILSMAIGGGIGSTAGGFKVIRLLIFLELFRVMILRLSSAKRAVINPTIAGHRLGESDVRGAAVLLLLFIGLIFVSWIPFVALGYDPLDSLFEVVSATATVGLSTGVTGPDLPAALKGVLCVDMLLGRLEIVAWLILLYPGTWIGRRLEHR
jgi:trk system potassium uptake protein TrkH